MNKIIKFSKLVNPMTKSKTHLIKFEHFGGVREISLYNKTLLRTQSASKKANLTIALNAFLSLKQL